MSKGPEFCQMKSEHVNFLINRRLSCVYYLCLLMLCRNLIASGRYRVALFSTSIFSFQVFSSMPVSLYVMLDQGTVAIKHEWEQCAC